MNPAQYKEERTQRGLTQAALASMLGVPREAVVRREAGTQPITPEAAMAILSLPKTKPAKPAQPNRRAEQRGSITPTNTDHAKNFKRSPVPTEPNADQSNPDTNQTL